MVLTPSQSLGPIVSLLEPSAEPSLLSRFFVTIGAIVLAVVTFVGVVARAIAARWRGILLAHIFFLTVWLAIQVFSFAKDAFAYLRDNIPTWVGKIEAPSSLLPYTSSSPNTSSSANTSSSLPQVSSVKPLTNNCWRDRSLDGNCFTQAETRRKAPPHRVRIPIPGSPPCYRFYPCRSDNI
jgi:hypothetical protein